MATGLPSSFGTGSPTGPAPDRNRQRPRCRPGRRPRPAVGGGRGSRDGRILAADERPDGLAARQVHLPLADQEHGRAGRRASPSRRGPSRDFPPPRILTVPPTVSAPFGGACSSTGLREVAIGQEADAMPALPVDRDAERALRIGRSIRPSKRPRRPSSRRSRRSGRPARRISRSACPWGVHDFPGDSHRLRRRGIAAEDAAISARMSVQAQGRRGADPRLIVLAPSDASAIRRVGERRGCDDNVPGIAFLGRSRDRRGSGFTRRRGAEKRRKGS